MRYRTALKNSLIALCCSTLLAGCASSHLSSNQFTSQGKHSSHFSFFRQKNIWTEMGRRMHLATRSDRSHLQSQLNWLSHRQAYIDKITTNAAPYVHYIYEQTRKRNMPAELALLPMIESAYNPFVFSRTGATGLWQMMPGTASGFGLQIDFWYDGRRDIVRSTNAALTYLSYLHRLFGDWLLAIAAYNAGEGTVQAAIKRNQLLHKSTSFWALPLPQETRSYVPQLLALAEVIKDPNRYGLELTAVPNERPFSMVQMERQLDIKQVAHLAHVKTSTVRQLNPAFRRATTSPNRSYTLLLPKESIEIFKMELAQAPTLSIQSKPTAVSWQHHRVKPGETLTGIARKYHTTVVALRKTNLMKNNVIQPHQTLLIPTANKAKVMSAAEARYAADKLPGPQQVIHTVSRWDSLANIARRYGVTPRQIQFWNNLHKDESVHTHQQLVLWLKHRYQPIITSRPSRYQVKRGDSLGAIATKYHVSVKAIQQANHLKGNAIRKGQWLSIPGTARPPVRGNASRLNKSYANHSQARAQTRALIHTVQHGQTLYSIARRYHVTPQQISQWNQLHGNVVKLGQRLVVHP